MNSSIFIRSAQPGDVDAIVPLIYSSGPAAWDYVFTQGSKTPFDFLSTSFIKSGNTISYKNHYVAELNGEVVGAIMSYRQPSFLLLNGGTALRIVSVYGFSAPKVMARGLITEGMIRPPKSGRLYLGHIAVSEKHRGKGIGKELIRFMAKEFPQFQILSLDVSQKNEAAIQLYKGLGFQTMEARSFSGPTGKVPDHFYMEVEKNILK
ncbi:GNAT family N-acetyltransferase [Leptospira stimsonii]|uniref:GNAT family N-acetyltransferase n=1 Tax=Leptospira stimsonii TaxID=2202203 RepID=A0A4R9KZQ0_9LEPT|nr:GNAT family N-acetyltransferase [Leptospira stimsonii]RHX88194.1 GNAT family N-acetyltransferase [Leptospira stimsonii]TGK23893.1 GNAT family N-acetyltransferase [Leptospira stimsonii]TGM10399.1 GNAT family N-acetyltransferase [Leptospira stimsonii]